MTSTSPKAIIGRKVGMTRYFLEGGKNIPVTVIQAGPCVVTQVKTIATDGYAAVQLGFEDIKARNSTMAVIGHDVKAGAAPKRIHKELRCADDAAAGAFTVGATVDASILDGVAYVDVIGVSKGKGFQGVMKKYGFKGLTATHGTERKHRSPGSIGSHGTDRGHGAKIKKGKRMAGQMGDDQVTVRSLDVIKIDAANSIILVKGAVPGANNGVIVIRAATRLYKRKAKKLS